MPPVTLDERLRCAAEMFPTCERGADIGADHGRLSLYLCKTNQVQHMVVSDISELSLQKARQLFDKNNLADRAQFVCADGLDALTHPVDAIAILGMGGVSVSKIISAHPEKIGNARLIVSAHTDIPCLRKTIYENGLHLTDERVVYCKNRFYVVMKAEKGADTISEKQLFMGPCLLFATDEVYKAYLNKRFGVVSCIQKEEAQQYLQWIREEQARVSNSQSSL